MASLLHGLDVHLIARPKEVPDVAETEDTLEGNALLKAHALVEATGYAAIADDTGLFVDALGGRPGVHSARYAGESASYHDNVVKLLGELEGVETARRGARFRTVVVVAYPQGAPLIVEGSLEGFITTEPVGDEGFGYDPVFAPSSEGGRTLAQLSLDEKNAISHRGQAMRKMITKIREVLASGRGLSYMDKVKN